MVLMNSLYKHIAFAFAFWFCLAATAAAAPETTYAEMAVRARNCGVSSAAVDRVTAAVEDGRIDGPRGRALLSPLLQACTGGLPLRPLEDKLDEGLAKRVPTPRIAVVLERKLDGYRRVRPMLEARFETVDPELLTVLGEGYYQGAPIEDIRAYVDEFFDRPQGPFLTGAHMVCLLGQAGFGYELTRSMLATAFAVGGPEAEWRFFIRVLLVARKRGLADADVAAAARHVLGAGGGLEDVSSRLGFTARSMTGRGRLE